MASQPLVIRRQPRRGRRSASTPQTITLNGGSAIHYDEALGTNGGTSGLPTISQVQ